MTDSIEDVDIELEIDGDNQMQAYLRLEGDFVDTCEKYLEDESASSITLKLSRGMAEKLHHELIAAMFGDR